MKRNVLFASLLLAAGAMFTACNNDMEEPRIDAQPEAAVTRAYGDKSPIVAVYVEINDNDPRIVTSYKDGNGKAFIDLTYLFASNIHKDANGDPTIYFNDKMAPMFADFHKSANIGAILSLK